MDPTQCPKRACPLRTKSGHVAPHGKRRFGPPGAPLGGLGDNRPVRLHGGLLSLGAVALTLGACDSDNGSESSELLDEAKSFDEYALYFVGDSYDDLPLSFAGLGPGSGEGLRRSWSFGYGDCDSEGEGGCPLPLEVQNWSICTRFPALYPGPTPRTESVRGAETLRAGGAGGGLDVYTGRTAVVIFGQGDDKAQVVENLRPVADGSEPNHLPPPAPAALEGKLPCQRGPLDRVSH